MNDCSTDERTTCDSAPADRYIRSRPIRAALRAGIGMLLGSVMMGVDATAGPAPRQLVDALASFQTEGPKGWSFTQTTVGDGHSRIERYDAAKPDFDRWSLLEQDGRTPTADELQDYREKLSRRSRGGTAPRLTDQFDLQSIETLATDAERTTYRLRLKQGEQGDNTARFLRATLLLHHATGTIESIELASLSRFTPTFGVTISEMRTALRYSLPEGDRPSLLLKTETRLRGRAFLLKSLDADMVVTFSDHERATRK